MSNQKDYREYLERQEELKSANMGHYFYDQYKRFVEPFKLYGNVYYVGDSWVCAYIIDTGEGLLLLDAGNCGAAEMMIHSIWSAGFNPADIKWIVLSHGHVDHIGAVNFLRNMFGCKVYLGEPDARMFEEMPELSYIQQSPDIMQSLFAPDVLINDGDVIKFGNIEISFYLVPGHTLGTIACFFDICDEEQGTKRAGYFGGFGFNTLTKEYLTEIGDALFSHRELFLNSLKKVRDQKVEVFLANHTINNQTVEKRELMKKAPGYNPFVNSQSWAEYLDVKRDAFIEFMNDPGNS